VLRAGHFQDVEQVVRQAAERLVRVRQALAGEPADHIEQTERAFSVRADGRTDHALIDERRQAFGSVGAIGAGDGLGGFDREGRREDRQPRQQLPGGFRQ
jgi:hypothetical protein